MSATPNIVTKEKWLEARKTLLQKEKAFTKERDALTRERQAMPWVKVEKITSSTALAENARYRICSMDGAS